MIHKRDHQMDSDIKPGQTYTPSAPVTESNPVKSSDSIQPDTPNYAVPEPVIHRPTVSRFKILILGLVAALVVGGGGVAAYFGVVLPNKPENIVKKALAQSLDVKTSTTSGVFEVTSSDFSTQIDFSGASDVTDASNPKFSFLTTLDALVTTMQLEGVYVDRDMYFKISGLEGVTELLSTQFGDDQELNDTVQAVLDGVRNNWFVLNGSLIAQSGIDPSLINEVELSKLNDLFTDANVLKIITIHDDAPINQALAHHYTVTYDTEALRSALLNAKGQELFGYTVTDEDVQNALELLDEMDTNPPEFELWIDKKTKDLVQIMFNEEQDGVRTMMRLTFDTINQPVDIVKPEGAKQALELLTILQDASSQLFGDELSEETFFDNPDQLPELAPATLGDIIYQLR